MIPEPAVQPVDTHHDHLTVYVHGQILGLRLAPESIEEHVQDGWDRHLARLP